ncbi:MAG: methyltransferase, partial [Phycisphaerae bacterium]|nr:methyltransferase [Phycisphaerae bacterium]
TVSKLREAVLGEKDYRVKVIEPYQMLGEIDDALADALGVDIAGAMPPQTLFGFANADWKELTLFDGTAVLVPGDFNITEGAGGDWYIHPQGDTSVAPSGHMPKDGYYFDAIYRQPPLDEDNLVLADNIEEFSPLPAEDIDHLAAAARSAAKADKGAILTCPGASFGDIALVPAMWLKHTKGIRDVAEWYMATVTHRDFVYRIFEAQCEIALANLERLAEAVGDDVQAVFTTGTDFGTQTGLFISPQAYCDLYQPFHKQINAFVHSRTNWKTFIHSCGAVSELIGDFIESGFDILNPVQCSAAGMNARKLKDEFGKDLVFWGGAVDTQKTLPFGTPQQVADEVRRRIDIFNVDGGFVFNAIHNVQAKVPIANILAMFEGLRG